MRKFKQPLLLFALGILLMATTQTLTQCIFTNDDDDLKHSINPDELKNEIDYKGISDLCEKVEDALLDADQAKLNELMFNGPGENYLGKNTPYTTEELAEIGKAFKKRELSVATSVFAEYTYEIDGKQFTLTFGLNDLGEWKLVRF